METLNLLSVEDVRTLENKAINQLNIQEIILMENAAYGAFNIIQTRYRAHTINILAGPGNNGGDGLALGRILYAKGYKVKIFFLNTPQYRGASEINFNSIKHIEVIKSVEEIKEGIVVDALFGIGLNREFDNRTRELINTINSLGLDILSLDTPSGLCCNSGKIIGGTAIKATITISFIAFKVGMFLYPGFNYCGELINDTLSIPGKLIKEYNSTLINSPKLLLKRESNSHKTSNGRVLVIGGSETYYGAPLFTGKSAMLSGSGYTTLISTPDIIKNCAINAPEMIYKEFNALESEIQTSDFTIFGPGIGRNRRSKSYLKRVIKSKPKKLLLDGDALFLLGENPELLSSFDGKLILTPHPKEAAYLLKSSVNEIENNRIKAIKELTAKFNATVVLKGAHSLIKDKSNTIFLNNCSSGVLATAGSGDVLAGMIAGFCCYMPLIDGVKLAVYIHSQIGIMLEKRGSNIGYLASDIMDSIPEILIEL